jgi:gluconate/galactonate dehydratase
MNITAVHTAVVEGNYDWTFVRIDTDADGLSGLGECYTAPGLTRIVRDLAPLLMGEDPRDVDRLWSKLRWGASGAGSPAGIVYNAISGMEAALWDLVGRAYGVPIHSLLGGRFRDSVRMYADCHAGDALESMDATMVARPARWGPGAPRGGQGRLDPRARARPRLRTRGARRAVHPRALRAARARSSPSWASAR